MTIGGDATINDLTAQHITASGNIKITDHISGSNISASNIVASTVTTKGNTTFGDAATDTHTFTGHITASGNISGSSATTLTIGGAATLGSTVTSHDDIILTDGSGGDTLVKIYDSDDDGIIDVYQNNSVVNRIHGNGLSFFKGGGIQIGDTAVGGLPTLTTGYTLGISGSISASGTIFGEALEVVGNISASATSSGSLGSLKVAGATVDFSGLPVTEPLVTGSLWVSGSGGGAASGSGYLMVSGIHVL